MNRWQVSTLVLSSMWVGAIFAPSLLNRVYAAPPDVFGSPNVAVTGFKTLGGSYTLWSDGHITNVPASPTVTPTTVNGVDAYTLPSGPISKPVVAAGKVKGSPNVAVGVLPTKTVTYVLFADGTPKIPTDSGAKQGSPDAGRVESGAFYGLDPSGQVADSLTSGVTLSMNSGSCTLTFDPPFTNAPIVSVQLISADTSAPQKTGSSYAYGYILPLPGNPAAAAPTSGSAGTPVSASSQAPDVQVSAATVSSVRLTAQNGASIFGSQAASSGASYGFTFTAVEPADTSSILRTQ